MFLDGIKRAVNRFSNWVKKLTTPETKVYAKVGKDRYAEIKGWPEKWEHHPPKEERLTTTEISDVKESLKEIQRGQAKKFTNTSKFLEELRKPGSQAIHKVSPKNFKPRPAHEKRLLKPKAKLEEEN